MLNIRIKIRDKIIQLFTMILAIAVMLPCMPANAITIDSDNEYTLYVDDYPGDVTNTIYAKFKTTKKNYEDYTLNLTEVEDMYYLEVLKKAKVTIDEDTIVTFFMTELLYTDPDSGDDKKKNDSVIVLCPIPDDAQEHPDDCMFYDVSSSTAKLASQERVKDDDGIIYQKFELPSYGYFSFVYKDPDSYEDEDEDDGDEDEDDGDEDEGDDDEGNDDGSDDGDNDNGDNTGDEDDDEDDEDEEDEDGTDNSSSGLNHEPIEPDDDSNFEYTDDGDDDDGFEYTDEDFDDEDDDFASEEYADNIDEFDSDAEDDDDEPYYYEPDDGGYYYESNENSVDGSETNTSESGSSTSSTSGSNEPENSESESSDPYKSDPHVLENNGSTEYDFDTPTRNTADTSYSGVVPKTGDEFPLSETIGLGVLSLAALIVTIILLIKRKP